MKRSACSTGAEHESPSIARVAAFLLGTLSLCVIDSGSSVSPLDESFRSLAVCNHARNHSGVMVVLGWISSIFE